MDDCKRNGKYSVRIGILAVLIVFILRLMSDQRFLELPESLKSLISISALVICVFCVFVLKKLRLAPLQKFAFFLLLFTFIFSVLNKSLIHYPSLAIKEILRFLYLFMVSLIVGQSFSEKNLLITFKLSFWLISLIAVMQLIGIVPVLHLVEGLRIESLTGHPNALANFYVVQACYWGKRAILDRERKSTVYLFLIMSLIIFTQSRTAMLFLVYVIIMLFYIKNKRVGISKIKLLIGFSISFICLLTFGSFLKERFIGEILILWEKRDFLVEMISSRQLEGSISWRLFNWYSLVNYGYQNNFFFGAGISTTDYLNYYITGNSLEAHNDYVKIFFETGFIGFVVYVSYIIIWLKSLFKKITNMDQKVFVYFFIGYNVFKMLDGIEQSNLFMIMMLVYGSATLKFSNEKNITNSRIKTR